MPCDQEYRTLDISPVNTNYSTKTGYPRGLFQCSCTRKICSNANSTKVFLRKSSGKIRNKVFVLVISCLQSSNQSRDNAAKSWLTLRTEQAVQVWANQVVRIWLTCLSGLPVWFLMTVECWQQPLSTFNNFAGVFGCVLDFSPYFYIPLLSFSGFFRFVFWCWWSSSAGISGVITVFQVGGDCELLKAICYGHDHALTPINTDVFVIVSLDLQLWMFR